MKRIIVLTLFLIQTYSMYGMLAAFGADDLSDFATFWIKNVLSKNPSDNPYAKGLGSKVAAAPSTKKINKASLEAEVNAQLKALSNIPSLKGTGGGGELDKLIKDLAMTDKSAALVAVVTGLNAVDGYKKIEPKVEVAGPKVLAQIAGSDAPKLAKAMYVALTGK